jgi:hypothetical protein
MVVGKLLFIFIGMWKWGWIGNPKPMMPRVRLDSSREGPKWLDPLDLAEFKWLFSYSIRTYNVKVKLEIFDINEV